MKKQLLESEADNLELDFERICILYANAKLGYFGIFLSLFFLGFIVSRLVTPNIALVWMVAVLLAYIPRLYLSIRFKRKLEMKQITPENIGPQLTFQNPYENGAFSGQVSSVNVQAFVGILFCAVTILSMIAGGSMAYSTSRKLILLFMNLTLLSLIIKCIWMQDILYIALAGYLVAGYIILTKLIFKQNKTLMENIALKIENRNQSFIDPLTELWNRRRLYLFIGKVIELSKRSGDPFSLILLDIDHFKRYNDTHGHNAGDSILIKISEILLDCSREQDLVVRYGGEEFIVVLPNTSISQAEIIAERILTNVRKNTDVTISAGLAQYTGQTDFDQLVNQADEALYAAKNSGRDRFVMAAAG